MKKEDFTHNLIQIAFCSIVCDSYIDKTEVEKLKEITEKDFYFEGFSLSKNIQSLEDDFSIRGLLLVNEILNNQLTLGYSESQKLIIIEIVIGIIKADSIIEQSEIDFTNRLIINLRIPSEVISSRFGEWQSLSNDKLKDN